MYGKVTNQQVSKLCGLNISFNWENQNGKYELCFGKTNLHIPFKCITEYPSLLHGIKEHHHCTGVYEKGYASGHYQQTNEEIHEVTGKMLFLEYYFAENIWASLEIIVFFTGKIIFALILYRITFTGWMAGAGMLSKCYDF